MRSEGGRAAGSSRKAIARHARVETMVGTALNGSVVLPWQPSAWT
jgi:hypothetical protein